jgi:5,10-methylenetetrahydrofolate reductase
LAFLRMVEVLPPLFPSDHKGRLPASAALDRFVEDVRGIRSLADVVLVANVKREGVLKVDPVHAAAALRSGLGIDAAPVVVVRDQNKPQFLSSMLTAATIGLRSAMVAWGDDYPEGSGASNVRDYPTLAKAIRDAYAVVSRVRPDFDIFAPVDIRELAHLRGTTRARERLKAGAALLLAQPPTTDPRATLERHVGLVEGAGLRGKVLLGVFHFKGAKDVDRYESAFGWKLPKALHKASEDGEEGLVELEGRVIKRMRREGLPGVCLSTRGEPAIAKLLL